MILSIMIVLQGPLLKHGVVIRTRTLKEEVTYLHRVNVGNDHVTYVDFYKNCMALMSTLSMMIIICEFLLKYLHGKALPCNPSCLNHKLDCCFNTFVCNLKMESDGFSHLTSCMHAYRMV